jgi:hypothetical protein
MSINGLLLDCARVVERHEYYFKLVDFMADWGMNWLMLHLCDDHGLAVALPGFESLASPFALSANEIRRLVAHARSRGIELVPELETFGHTRYLTDADEYADIRTMRKRKVLGQNAVDPRHPKTFKVMEKLIRATGKLFPSRYLHIGCDEVDLREYHRRHPGLDPASTWTEYVNRMIGMAREAGKEPLIWADHLIHDSAISARVRKDVTVVWWDYFPRPPRKDLRNLRTAGFKEILVTPSTACCWYRFLPTEAALNNVDSMARYVAEEKSLGILNSVWCPFRYLQGAMYYGIAYAAEQTRCGGTMSRTEFNRQFAERMFGLPFTAKVKSFFALWPRLHINDKMTYRIMDRDHDLPAGMRKEYARVNAAWWRVRTLGESIQPRRNQDVWEEMRVAGDAAGLCSEWMSLRQSGSLDYARMRAYNKLLRETRCHSSRIWDRTRYPEDPLKTQPRFPNEGQNYALLLLRRLPVASARTCVVDQLGSPGKR